MKILDKITLILFSMIILILAVIMSLLVFGWVTPTVVLSVYGKIVASNVVSNTILGVSGVCIVLALKAIFFG